jgi:hypothetical protein
MDGIKNSKRASTADAQRSGRPSVSCSGIKEMLDGDRRMSEREIEENWGTTIHKIITDNMSMTKQYARWVPKMLTDEKMKTRVRISSGFLQRFHVMKQIVITDETLFHLYEPETKLESMVRKSPFLHLQR